VKRLGIIALAAVGWAASNLGAAIGPGPATNLTALVLNDQFGAAHRVAFPQTNVCIVTIAGRQGAAQVSAWVEALRARGATNLTFIPIADVSEVPGFFRKRVQKGFQERYSHPVLLDWAGVWTKRFDAPGGAATLIILDRSGRVRARASGPVQRTELDRLAQAIKQAE
jgi:hypothetical protein